MFCSISTRRVTLQRYHRKHPVCLPYGTTSVSAKRLFKAWFHAPDFVSLTRNGTSAGQRQLGSLIQSHCQGTRLPLS